MSDTVRLEFTPTPAVAAARSHNRYAVCPACQRDVPKYLFHRVGVRFVRCASCDAVYVNPAREHPVNNFDIANTQRLDNPHDRDLMVSDMAALLEHVAQDHDQLTGAPLRRTLLLGRYLPEFAALRPDLGLDVPQIGDEVFAKLAIDSDIRPFAAELQKVPQVVILQELLESCSDPGAVVAKLVAALPPATLFVVTYTNADSLPARVLRRNWAQFFGTKSSYLSTGNLSMMLGRHGLVLKRQYPMPVNRTAGYVAEMMERLVPNMGLATVAKATPLRDVRVPVRAGNRVAVFGRSQITTATEKLSIIMPVFNEHRFAAQVIDTVLAKQLPIDREVIIVESNSTDGTREIVQRYEGHPGVRVIYEDRPRGKGHAVRTGLQHVTGTIVLIQDSDFEYDIDDYDALLEPLLQRKAMFVLGSRSLGLDDWKVRKYDATPIRGALLNFAQVMFAKTYNVLYQQRATDVNTMFKVFRSECL
ncbi:MAG: glycosyltransferase, partial [Deltaproteobacteria bacterium]